ncbi:DUF2971 domain-containing protein [Nitrincola tapanii]|uniref:DUF2971 domain-containing protein n=1 Tax=Nitrincola tapanii TaxID=1708751 RepID=A0A5A9W701_9GAMM|nr:DUF2971 domain-containing protein [Nitrincola tapanii]KAA0876570.1 DUF2971 domain-containing protein [Nitrincola tapanii]
MTDIPTLYKYMPYQAEFFSNFYLRCTPRSALNDPFEMLPSTDYLIYHACKRQMPQSVIDNLLMWSHYADEHRGMVLELDRSHSFFPVKSNITVTCARFSIVNSELLNSLRKKAITNRCWIYSSLKAAIGNMNRNTALPATFAVATICWNVGIKPPQNSWG